MTGFLSRRQKEVFYGCCAGILDKKSIFIYFVTAYN